MMGRGVIAGMSYAVLVAVVVLWGLVGLQGHDAAALFADTVGSTPSFDPCNKAPTKTFLMLVSTMDGVVTALNGHTGTVQWTLPVGSGPLLSSSISNLELSRNGSPSRLVPSLDGGLYQIDEDGIEPVPLAVDAMLSSSFRFSDDSMIIGAKEIESYGINLNSGKFRYMCSSDGCNYFDEDKIKGDGGDEMLIIRRNDKTVRAVEMQTGLEKWNFSVGQHEISYLYHAPLRESTSTIDEIGDADSEQCHIESDGPDETLFNFEHLDFDKFDPADVRLKVLVSTGKILAFSRSRPGLIYWQHKFDMAVASTWVIRDGKLSEVDLFDSEIVPVLGKSEGFTELELDGSINAPVLYLGSYNKQLYVQPSVRFIQEVELATEDALKKGSLVDINMPKVVWRPYIATAASRTPTVVNTKPRLQISWDENGTHDKTETGVVKWQNNYPFDEGYYLFPDYTPLHFLDEMNRTVMVETNSFRYLLRQQKMYILLALVFLCGIALGGHFYRLKYRCKMQRHLSELQRTESEVSPTPRISTEKSVSSEASDSTGHPLVESPEKSTTYVSRFASDFAQEACLGRGGFGVVFKVVNRLDDCEYAVKRIALHDSERAREKVMREVKALARLDHPGIVRYYQSWLERPPPGWQEERDRACLDVSMATPSQDCIATDYSSSAQVSNMTLSSIANLRTADKMLRDFNPLKPSNLEFDLGFNDALKINRHSSDVGSFSLCSGSGTSKNSDELLSRSTLNDDSLGISFHGNGPNNDDDSYGISFRGNRRNNDDDSYGISFRGNRPNNNDDSLEISFRGDGPNNDGAWSKENNGCDIPTQNCNSYEHSDDFEIVFEKDSEISSSGMAAAGKERLLSGEKRSIIDLPKTPSVLQRPNSLELCSCGAASGDKKHAGKTQKLYLYIQMQLCQSESLKDWLSKAVEDRDRNRLLDIFHQIVRAISYVHRQGLMHRDLKPSNIFFALDGMVKIGDFGLVTAAEEKCTDDDGYASNPSLATKHTNQVGTTLYMSPEQSASGSYTYKVDIYALGMIFFELFFPFQTQMERIRTLQGIRQLKFPKEFVENSSTEYEFVLPLLSHDPDLRPSTQEILQNPMLVELEEAAEALNRLHSQARQRTTSQSSGNSTGSASTLAQALS